MENESNIRGQLEFRLNNDTEMKALAVFLAQLVREGVTVRIKKDRVAVAVELTGGY